MVRVETQVSSDEAFESIFKKALVEISARYIPGSVRYGEERFPSIKKEIMGIEKELNRIWKSNPGDNEKLKEFRELLKKWYFLHLKIIESYKKRK